METQQTSIIKQDFAKYIYEITIKNIVIKLVLAILILLYFVYSDLGIRHNIHAFYTRILPISIAVSLLIFHLFTVKKYHYAKTKIYNIFLATIGIMMFGKCLVHLHEQSLASVISGTILVIFLISLEIKTNTLNTVIIYFLPSLIFIAFLIFGFDVSKEEHISLSNIYPIIIIGFTVNRIQYNLRFNIFKSNYLLEVEKGKTEQLYQETLTMNEDLYQKNEEITVQRDEIEDKKNKIEKQHAHIQGSINYAKRIQEAMLPTKDIFENNFSDYFIFYKPLDVVSGDFYWAEKFGDKIIYAVADCTGHGVPGAMVSMLGISLFNKITTQNINLTASEILEQLRIELKNSLKQTGKSKNETKDGIDIALCVIDIKTKELQFSGAYNSLYIRRNNELIELKANRQPIGFYMNEKPFTNHNLQLQEDDILYSFSDGYTDQFNPNNEKYKIKRLKELLLDIAPNKLQKQKEILENEFIEWKGINPQIDDIVIVGIKI